MFNKQYIRIVNQSILKEKTMKIFPLLLFLLSSMLVLKAQDTTFVKGARIEFSEKVKDYGDILYGDSIKYTFKFTNTGNEKLIISDVKTTCICTTVEFPKDTIAAGQSGELKVTFRSAKQEGTGRQRKTISVISNGVNNYEQGVLILNILKK